MTDDLSRLLNPGSVAIVGASEDTTKRGYRAIAGLQTAGYEGDIYPVNPGYDEPIQGLQVYPSVTEIPGRVDLAFLAVPASVVPDVLEECAEAGIPGAVVVAAGFGEADNDDLQDSLQNVIRDTDIRVVGPNTQGILNVHRRLDLFDGYDIPPGSLAVLTQSGNLGLEFAAEAKRRGNVGFSYEIGVGNESDLRFDEYLPYLATDEHTEGVVAYAEGFSVGRSFLQGASEFTTEKPIVLLKGGQTDAGRESAALHTASLAGDSAVARAACRQAGVHLVTRSEHVVPVAHALTALPTAEGDKVAVLTDGGGHATLASDAIAREGLSLPDLASETRDRLADLVPTSPNVSNPVDVMGQDSSLETFTACADLVLADPNVDVLLLAGRFGGHDLWGADETEAATEPTVAAQFGDLVERYETPVVAHSLGAGLGSPGVEALQEVGVPVCASLDTAVACVDALVEYGDHCENAHRKSDFELPGSVETPSKVADHRLSEYESRRMLRENGLPVVDAELATTPDEARNLADGYDGPVAMKVVARDLVHKTDVGGVALDVPAENSATTFERIVDAVAENRPDVAVDGVLVSPMLEGYRELVVGVVDDDEFGRALMVGLGGIFVETLQDVSFRMLPVTRYDARSMLEDLTAQNLLDGHRGGPGVDREAVVELLVSVSEFVVSNPGVGELDLNPVFAREDETLIGDATIHVDGAERPTDGTAGDRGAGS